VRRIVLPKKMSSEEIKIFNFAWAITLFQTSSNLMTEKGTQAREGLQKALRTITDNLSTLGTMATRAGTV